MLIQNSGCASTPVVILPRLELEPLLIPYTHQHAKLEARHPFVRKRQTNQLYSQWKVAKENLGHRKREKEAGRDTSGGSER